MGALKVILIILAVVIVWLSIRYIYIMRKCHFKCPECKFLFKPKATQLIFSMNAGLGKVFKCPNCKASVYMEPKKD